MLAGLSLLPFKIRGESERIFEEFDAMPSATPDQVEAKFRYGDRRFQELAESRRDRRIVGGVVEILAGVAGLVFFDEDAEYVYPGPLVGGVLTLLIKSEEERRYETYVRARGDLGGR